MTLALEAYPVTVRHNCFHEVKYTIRAADPPESPVYVPVMCPECEDSAGLLTCLTCGGQHEPEDCLIYAPAVAIGRECAADKPSP